MIPQQAHRIRLHGPWQLLRSSAPDSRFRLKVPGTWPIPAANQLDATDQLDAPESATRLESDNEVVFQRSWNRPTGLSPSQHLAIEISSKPTPADVSCNGQLLQERVNEGESTVTENADTGKGAVGSGVVAGEALNLRAYDLPVALLQPHNQLCLKFSWKPQQPNLDQPTALIELATVTLCLWD